MRKFKPLENKYIDEFNNQNGIFNFKKNKYNEIIIYTVAKQRKSVIGNDKAKQKRKETETKK